MVVRNQEARDALETYFKTFDITKFPGKNVPTACLRLKAVALDHSNEEIVDIQDALDTEVEKLKESTANPLPIAAEEWQG